MKNKHAEPSRHWKKLLQQSTSTDKKDEKEISVLGIFNWDRIFFFKEKKRKEAKAKKKQSLIKSESEQCITSNFFSAK